MRKGDADLDLIKNPSSPIVKPRFCIRTKILNRQSLENEF